MDLAYCTLCGGSFVKDAETDTTCGDCDPGEVMPDLTFTKAGDEWSEVVNEIDWLQQDEGDLTHAFEAIENQLGPEYWDSTDDFTITVPDHVAKLIRQVENTDAAERAELDRRLAERDRAQAAE